ncbi:protein ALP1-like isoform X1, partial [Aphis craccivora]
YLSTGCSFRSLAFTFRMGITSVARIVIETCNAIWNILSKVYIPVPTNEMWKTNAKDFYNKWNFPNCLGSIDGKHVRIDQPEHSGSMYYNYKHFYSINLFAISDVNYKFIIVDIGAYGRESDGGVLKNSVFFNKLQKKELSIPDDIELPNTNIIAPYTFIGDEAFPLLINILRPYPGKQLINDEKKETNVEHAIVITKAICVLHNIVLTYDQQSSQVDNLEGNTSGFGDIGGRKNNRFGRAARDSREIFTEYFSSEAGTIPWQLDCI